MRATLAIVCVVFLLWTGYVQSNIQRSVTDLRSVVIELRKETKMATLTATWKTEDNITHTVTTNQQEDESSDAFSARHKALVDAAKALFPPV